MIINDLKTKKFMKKERQFLHELIRDYLHIYRLIDFMKIFKKFKNYLN
jgi:hypothetical protein